MTSHISHSPHTTAPALRWGAILAGGVVAAGTMMLLLSLGLACGLTSLDVHAEGRLRALGLFAGAWGAVTPVLALFAGGWVASRAADATAVGTAALQGAVLWGVVSLGCVWLSVATVSGVMGGAAALGRGAAQAGGQVLATGAGALGELGSKVGRLGGAALDGALEEAPDLDAASLLEPINAALVARGRRPITAEQAREASRSAALGALRSGKVDRQLLVDSIVRETSVSAEDARKLADGISEQLEHARAAAEAGREQAQEALAIGRDRARAALDTARAEGVAHLREAANDASDQVAKLFWGVFAALTLGLAAAIGGSAAAVAVRRA